MTVILLYIPPEIAPLTQGQPTIDNNNPGCAVVPEAAMPVQVNNIDGGGVADDRDKRALSFFEFWPGWVMYLPVVLLWLWQSLLSRSFTVSLLANPRLPLGGMVGVPKSLVLNQINQGTRLLDSPISVLPWCVLNRTAEAVDIQLARLEVLLSEHDLACPLVFKPDCGCRGAGVKKVISTDEARAYLNRFPAGYDIFVQQLATYELEAGIFYVREPESETGRVVSLTLKHLPSVTGDGQRTLSQLVACDRRAGQKTDLYQQRLADRWREVIPEGEVVSLVFSASHCRGAVFQDVRELITPELEGRIGRLMKQLPEFHYGRLDVKVRDLNALAHGESIEIIEINGASAEQIHIWDSRTRFRDAIGSLLWQYRVLYRLGKYQRRQGHRPPGLMALLKAWRREKAVTKLFPVTD